jgi:gentisate 1,2-dioxygenase
LTTQTLYGSSALLPGEVPFRIVTFKVPSFHYNGEGAYTIVQRKDLHGRRGFLITKNLWHGHGHVENR